MPRQRWRSATGGLLALLALWIGVGPGRAAESVFPERFAGEGVVRRAAKWNDEPLPVNIRNQWGLINQRGELIVEPRFDWVDYMFDGLVRVWLDGRTGYIGIDGDLVIHPIYRYADRYAEGSAIVGDGRRYGYINRRGVQFVPYQYDEALRFRDQRAAVMVNGRMGYIDRRGDVVIDLVYKRGRSFSEGVAVVERSLGPRDSELAFINTQGEVVYNATEAGVSALGDFSDGLAAFKKGERWGYMDRKFEVMIEPTYEEVREFESGLAAVRVGELWGYIDKEGQVVIEPAFEQAWPFTDVLAMVSTGGLRGFIDREGELAIDAQFDEAAPFFREVARVGQTPSFGYIDINGRPIWDPRSVSSGILDFTDIQANGSPARMPLPPRGRARSAPYPPDWQYVPELPKPRERSRM